MCKVNTHWRIGYVLAIILGALGGGMLVVLATRAIPKMMSKMMSGMMQNMMGQMEKEGFNPGEMCQQMMAKFSTVQQKEKQQE